MSVKKTKGQGQLRTESVISETTRQLKDCDGMNAQLVGGYFIYECTDPLGLQPLTLDWRMQSRMQFRD